MGYIPCHFPLIFGCGGVQCWLSVVVPWFQRRCPCCIPVILREYRISCGISRYSTGNPVESHDSHRTKKTIEMIYLPERRGESCESTSPVNYQECASRPYLSYRNPRTSVGLWLPWYKSVIPCLFVVYHEYTQQKQLIISILLNYFHVALPLATIFPSG